ncbi:MAG: hypothetical protein OEV49_03355 [candidate division Zixibacteria bacterium]|nr:hypothetical protein [candidate division Zixibacteria bacterium]MDH3936590.1 hypothetical protein [candidate division Zixibacteria bacterium]MDH4033473.1 hypothetical protein [candidate division Zixibacteria bacterium]
MSILLELIIFGAVDLLLESLAWGTCGYIFFRFIGINKKYWYWDCLFVFAVYLLWLFWSNAFVMSLDISISNQEFLTLIDNDVSGLFETDYFDVVIGALEIFLGYLIGRHVLGKLTRRQTA